MEMYKRGIEWRNKSGECHDGQVQAYKRRSEAKLLGKTAEPRTNCTTANYHHSHTSITHLQNVSRARHALLVQVYKINPSHTIHEMVRSLEDDSRDNSDNKTAIMCRIPSVVLELPGWRSDNSTHPDRTRSRDWFERRSDTDRDRIGILLTNQGPSRRLGWYNGPELLCTVRWKTTREMNVAFHYYQIEMLREAWPEPATVPLYASRYRSRVLLC